MSILRKIGNFAGKVLKGIGKVGGGILKTLGNVKSFADQTGLTGAMTNALMSNPMTAPLGIGLAASGPAANAIGMAVKQAAATAPLGNQQGTPMG